ncbi:uncharacterized protein FIESC28_02993 [Fusarium coffeatum]|uniref:Uncharacterized protein n=1 Tax=Fusarium coffeatum TaxID=231269 RepID=A0A366S6F5_9HYPO|nr:uncharacterized protein FIESC28_02993 [Fusarium coffeatum]RBR24260.1 hypothetical protein FIESC28_02993 [Fusarium coffeatum]
MPAVISYSSLSFPFHHRRQFQDAIPHAVPEAPDRPPGEIQATIKDSFKMPSRPPCLKQLSRVAMAVEEIDRHEEGLHPGGAGHGAIWPSTPSTAAADSPPPPPPSTTPVKRRRDLQGRKILLSSTS